MLMSTHTASERSYHQALSANEIKALEELRQ